MPTTTNIEVNYNRRVQLDQYEPIQHGVTLTAEVTEDEDLDEAYDELRERAQSMVEHAIAERVATKQMAEEGEG